MISEDTERGRPKDEQGRICVCAFTSAVHLKCVWLQGDLCHTFRE